MGRESSPYAPVGRNRAYGRNVMKRTAPVVFAVLALLMGVLLGSAMQAGAIPAPPYDTNAECLECHAIGTGLGTPSAVDFTAVAVDYTRCRTCHGALDPIRNGHEHFNPAGTCRALCHYFPVGAPFDPPKVLTAYGWFNSVDSLTKSSATLHARHLKGNWVDTSIDRDLGCSLCHAPSACSACHGTGVAHSPHAVSAYPAVAYRQATGTKVTTTLTTCVNPACHKLTAAGTASFTPTCISCHPTVEHHEVHNVTGLIQSGCKNCHSVYLDTEHSTRGFDCAACHASSDPLVIVALSGGKRTCESCHPRYAHRRGR